MSTLIKKFFISSKAFLKTFSSKKSLFAFSFAILFLYSALIVFAIPPASPYAVGDNITDPACPPNSLNCYVTSSSGVGIGDLVSNGTPSSILYLDGTGNLTQDSLFTRNPSTKETNIFHDTSVNISTGEYVLNAYPALVVNVSGSGSFTIGETVTGQSSGATAVVEGFTTDGNSEYILYVSNVSGTFISNETLNSTFAGTVSVQDDVFPSNFAVGDSFVEFNFPNGTTGVAGTVTAVSGDSITVNVTGGTLTPNNILFNTTQSNNYRGMVSAQPVTVSGTAHTGFTLSNIAIGTPFSGSGMYSELNGNKLFAGIINGYQFGIFSEISGTPSGYYLPTTAGTTGQALISLGGNTVGWGTLPSAISVNSDGTLYSGTLGAGEGDGDNIFLGQYAGDGATSASNSNFLGYSAGQNATSAYNSNFLGSNAGNGATGAYNSNFFGQSAGSGATNASYSNFLGSSAGNDATDASYSNFLGSSAGSGATNASYSNFFGLYAGQKATGAQNSNFLGYSAGENATNASYSNFFGLYAGQKATGAQNSNFFGAFAGQSATNASYSNFLGSSAGSGATGASGSNFFGYGAGQGATSASNSNFLGYYAGDGATSAYQSNFLGNSAGSGATNASYSNFLGNSAGSGATDASYSNFFGYFAGYGATNAQSSNFLGYSAGSGATYASNSNFLGSSAGNGATGASSSNFFGYFAGYNATNASNSIFIGKSAGQNDTVNNTGSSDDFSILLGPNTSTGGYSNSIALGGSATNTASNQFMIGSTTRPIDTTVWKGSAGTTCTLTTGTGVACSSDERLKTNITDLTTDTLEKLLNLKTVKYNWLQNPTSVTQIGFLAQDLEQYFPELVATDSTGYKSVYYSQITPVLVEAIREMNMKVVDLNDLTKENTWRDAMISWLGNASNKITRIFTGELCLYDENGQTECINASQLRELKQNLNTSSPSTPPIVPPTTSDSTPLTCTTPQILNQAGDACIDPVTDTPPSDTGDQTQDNPSDVTPTE